MKKNCYIYWDGPEVVNENDKRVHVQCEECFKKNKKGIIWGGNLLYGPKTIKCTECDTIIYKKTKRKKGTNEASI